MPVTVYRFRYFDPARRTVVVAEDYATGPAIRAMGAEPIRQSAMRVSASDVAPSGLLLPETAEPLH